MSIVSVTTAQNGFCKERKEIPQIELLARQGQNMKAVCISPNTLGNKQGKVVHIYITGRKILSRSWNIFKQLKCDKLNY